MSYIQVFCYSIISLPFYGMLNGQPQTLKRCGCPFIIELAYICRHPPFGTGQGFAGGKHFYIVLRDYLNRKLLITVLADPDKLPIYRVVNSFCPAGWAAFVCITVMHYIPGTFHCLHLHFKGGKPGRRTEMSRQSGARRFSTPFSYVE